MFDTLLVVKKQAIESPPHVNIDGYQDYTEVWAESRFLQGRNLYAAKAANVKTTVEFIIGYREDIDETMIVVNKHNNKTYHIEGILPVDNQRNFLILKCYELVHDELG